MLPSSRLISHLDYLSEQNIVKINKSSYLGILATLILIALSLYLYIPPTISCLNGSYSGSTFLTRATIGGKFYSKDDFKLAIVFKHSTNGSLFNHTQIMHNLRTTIVSGNIRSNGFRQNLVLCEDDYFSEDLNGEIIKECLKIPDYAEYEPKFISNYQRFQILKLEVTQTSKSLPFISSAQTLQNSFLSKQQKYLKQLLQEYYFQVIFSTKVLAEDGSVKFRMQKVSSTQFDIGSDKIGAYFSINLNFRENLIDSSILPWRNNKNLTFLDWQGEIRNGESVSQNDALKNGINGIIYVDNTMLTSYRTYKKIDWLGGIIGGGVFLLYIMIWLPLGYLNSGLLKIELANQLLLQKNIDHPETQEGLIKARIPKLYLLKRLIPFCKDNKHEKVLEQVENENDICLLIKKMKVAVRNIKKKQLQQDFLAKVVIFQEEQKHFEEESQNESSQNTSRYEDVNSTHSAGKHKEKLANQQSKQNLLQQTKSPIKKGTKQKKKAEKQQKNKQEQSNQQQSDYKSVETPMEQNLKQSANKFVEDSEQFQNQTTNKQSQQKEIRQFKIKQQVIEDKERKEKQIQNNMLIERLRKNGDDQKMDSKMNLTLNQLHHIKRNPFLEPYFENHPTYMILKEQKHDNFQQIMELEEYDKWQGHFPKKKFSIRAKISEILQFFDIFGTKYQFLGEPHNTTTFGIIIGCVILTLSILTFCLTIANYREFSFKKQPVYFEPNEISFKQVTSQKFNMLACFYNSYAFTNTNPLVNLTLYTYDKGVTTEYTPIRLEYNSDYLNFQLLDDQLQFYFYRTDCFRLPNSIPISMNKDSYFGYKITPLCQGTEAYCNSIRNKTIDNFKNAVNNQKKTLILPAYNFDPKNMTLFNSPINNTYHITHFINMSQFNNYQQTLEVHQTKVYSDTQNLLIRNEPKLIDENLNADYSIRRTRFKSIEDNKTQYVMKIKLGPTANKITISNKKIDWLFGIIGGILVFWYAIVQIIAKLYSRFNFYLYVSKIVYEQEGYDDNPFIKFLAMSFWPRIFIPQCFQLKTDVTRMRLMNQKMTNSINHLSILKYTQICYKLSSAFFSSLPGKHMSLIYFRQKIHQNAYVQNPLEPTKQQIKQQDFVDPIKIPLVQQKLSANTNKIFNDHLQNQEEKAQNERFNGQEKKMQTLTKEYREQDFKEMQAQRQLLKAQQQKEQQAMNLLKQYENEHIIDRHQRRWTDYLDLFPQQAQFYFQRSNKSTSVCGGLLSMTAILLIILLSVYQMTIYFKRYQSVTSDITLDISNQGLTLVTGKNFKIGVNFLNKTNLLPVNVSSSLSDIGIAIRKQKYERTNSMITPTITTIPFEICPKNYLESWMSKTIEAQYHQGLKYSYCAPDNIFLQLQGESSDLIRKLFKFTIYNKQPTVNGSSKLNTFLNLYHVQLHFSSPQQNSIKRNLAYEINSQILAYFGPSNPVRPFETNITLSKLNITYDDSTNWASQHENTISYIYEPYSKEILNYRYNSNPATNSWYNVSFSYTKKMQSYIVTSSKFVEVFGMVGGIIVLFFLIFGCFAISFNRYKMKYEIGKELYLFDKLRIVHQKDKIRKLGKKSKSERYEIQKINHFSELDILQAYLLSFFGYILKDFNFNKNLRRITLIQQKVTKDLDLSLFYLDLYKTRNSINRQISKKIQLNFKLTDVYFKKIINTNPLPYNMPALKNYAKQHKLSSYEQYIVVRAIQNGVNIRQILDSRILEKLFNFIDDGASIHLNRLQDTNKSIQSSLDNRSETNQEA